MKRRNEIFSIFVLCMLVLFGSAACGKPKVEPSVVLQEVLAEYPVDNILTIAGAPDGTVYLANLVQPENIKDSGYYIYHYDEKGECLGTYPMGEYCLTHGMAVGEDGTLYFIAEHSDNVLRLFAFRTETEQIEEVCRFPYFKQVKKLVYLDGRLYVLGQESWGTGFTDFSTGEYDFSAGERLVYCDSKTGEVYGLNFDFPINIAPGEGCLTVLGYLESEGYCVMEYDPAADTMRVRQKLEAFLFDDFAVCNDGNSLLYSYASNQFGLLLSDYGNLEQEAEVYRGALQLTQVEYAGGRIYCEDGRSGHLVGFPFSAVQRTKRVIHLITASYSVAPYGCGYVLDRIDMNWDKIVLKTLAQDKDYDLCIASSADTGSRVMKESDSFYPLNDIPGVEEYLNCCLPYVREAAMKEDGTIWMLPFRVEAKGLLVQEEKLAKEGVSIHEGMSYAEFAEMIHGLSEQEKEWFCISTLVMVGNFMNQYLWHHVQIEEDSFREDFLGLLQLYRDLPGKDYVVITEDILCRQERFGSDSWFERFDLEKYEQGDYRFYGFPKAGEADKDNLECFFIAVNPNSENLTEALSYIADLAAYLAAQENIWYFKDYAAKPGSFAEQVHRLYQNGEIPFAVDSDVYRSNLLKVLSGEITPEEYVEETVRKLKIYYGE